MSKIDKLLVDLLFQGRITQSEMLAIAQAVEEYQGTNGIMPPLDEALVDLKKRP